VSQENINVVQSFFDALGRGDIGAAAASLDPQIELRTSDPRQPLGGLVLAQSVHSRPRIVWRRLWSIRSTSWR
jgi:hypothetical protein